MGKRSINSTKAGKFMNPTDQARKEARRKELKKNKKQRQQVREAVIKQKDPKHILNDLDSLDKLEFDVNNPPPYSAKVIQEKRKRLKDQWHKIYQFYQKEDPKLAYELKHMELDYERRHQLMSQHHESIIQAQRVKLDDIPLPDMDMPSMPTTQKNTLLPLFPPPLPPQPTIDFSLIQTPQPLPPPPPPPTTTEQPKSILKTTTNSHQISEQCKTKLKSLSTKPPGPPASSPPDLTEFECDDDELELGLSLDDQYKSSDKTKKIRFNESPSSSTQSTANINSKSAAQVNAPAKPSANSQPTTTAAAKIKLLPPPPPPPVPSSQPFSTQAPPSHLQPYRNLAEQQRQYYQQYTQPVASQKPNTTSISAKAAQSQPPPPPPPASSSSNASTPATTTIEAKPVLRNKLAEITRFVPTTLMVRRDATAKGKQGSATSSNEQLGYHQAYQSGPVSLMNQPFNFMSHQQQQYASLNPLNFGTATSIKSSFASNSSPAKQSNVNSTNNKKIESTDAAYESFMKEIGKLL